MEGEERGVVGVCRSQSVFLGFCRGGKERASVGETRERGKERREDVRETRGETRRGLLSLRFLGFFLGIRWALVWGRREGKGVAGRVRVGRVGSGRRFKFSGFW